MNYRQQRGKKAALVALGLSAVMAWKQPLIVQAQPEPGGPPRSGEARRFGGPDGRRGLGGRRGLSLDRLASELNLTAQQKAKIKPILDSAGKRAQALRQNTTLSREEQRSRMRQIMTQTNDRISAVLTTSQKQKLAQMRQRGPGFGPRGSRGPGFERGFGSPAERLRRLDEAVKLTSKRKAQPKPVMEQADKRMTALRNNTKLSPEKKREQARSISQSVRNTMDRVLTAAQKQKLAASRRERGRRGFSGGPGQRRGPGRSRI